MVEETPRLEPGDAEAETPSRAAQPAAAPPLSWIFLLAGVTAIGPFAMQAIAPALPAFAVTLQISDGAAQAMISTAMLGIAFGAVIYGPLSDHYGRRPVLLWGLSLSVIGALAACAAPSFEFALIGRIAQAVGAGAGMVLARAAAQDLYGAEGAAAVIAKITAVMVVAPMLAPAIGGALTAWVGWRGIFAAIALVSLVLIFWAHRRFEETARALSPRLELRSALADYREVARRPAFRAHAMVAASLLASFFLFVSGGPYVLERGYGIGPALYGAMFVVAAGVYMAANLASPRATERFGRDAVLRLALAFGAAGCALVATLLWALEPAGGGAGVDWAGGGAMLLGLCLHAAGTGLATPNAIAGAVAAYPERAGSASSLVSVVQFLAAALAAQAVSLLPLDRGAPLLLAMGALLLVGWLGYRALSPAIKR